MAAIVYLITFLSLAVVVGTRLRLRGGSSAWLRLHTALGLVGFVIWLVFLIAPSSSRAGGSVVGLVGLGCWWVVSVVGLMLIPSARPGGGRRAVSVRRGGGHVLATLVHVGMVVAWLVCTWAYATKKV